MRGQPITRGAAPPVASVVLGVLLAVVGAGCSLVPGYADPDVLPLTVENGTDIDLVLVVNGRAVAVPHGMSAQLGTDVLGPRPWAIEARTAVSGRRIGSMDVLAGVGTCTADPGGSTSCTGVVDLHDLSCGRFVMAVGVPSVPAPAADAGEPGDCDP